MALNQFKNVLKATLAAGVLVAALISCSAGAAGGGALEQVNPAAELFNKKCSLCHGMSGDKQLSGAKKLTESELELAEIEAIVANGLRQMPAFSAQLTAEEIKAVSEYAFSFRTK